jgi:hypothetical protein
MNGGFTHEDNSNGSGIAVYMDGREIARPANAACLSAFIAAYQDLIQKYTHGLIYVKLPTGEVIEVKHDDVWDNLMEALPVSRREFMATYGVWGN